VPPEKQAPLAQPAVLEQLVQPEAPAQQAQQHTHLLALQYQPAQTGEHQ
jgi:hypothetical protein